MTDQRISWERYWQVLPENEQKIFVKPYDLFYPKTSEVIQREENLLLTGPFGSGKTYEIRFIAEQLKTKLLQFRELGSNQEDIKKNIEKQIEKSQTICIDGLDEWRDWNSCKLINDFSPVIRAIDQSYRNQGKPLRWIFASRQSQLRLDFFNDLAVDSLKFVHLLLQPLEKKEIIQKIKEDIRDDTLFEDFFTEAEKKNAWINFEWPRHLTGVVKYWRKNMRIPSLPELYEMRTEETLDDSYKSQKISAHPIARNLRYQIHQLAALLFCFSNKRAFAIPPYENEEDLRFKDLNHGANHRSEDIFISQRGDKMSKEDWERTIEQSAMMAVSCNQESTNFQSGSEAEYLAASALKDYPIDFLKEFLGKETSNGWRCYPDQATRVATFLMQMKREFRIVSKNGDPEFLLQMDWSEASVLERKKVVDRLFYHFRENLIPIEDETDFQLHTLSYTGIEADIEKYIREKKHTPEQIRFAIRLIASCSLQNLFHHVQELFTNKQVDLYSHDLANLIQKSGNSLHKNHSSWFLSLYKNPTYPDPEMQIQGAVLIVLLNHYPVRALIEDLLSPPPFYFGKYHTALRNLSEKVTVDDLPSIWSFLKRKLEDKSFGNPFKNLEKKALAIFKLNPNHSLAVEGLIDYIEYQEKRFEDNVIEDLLNINDWKSEGDRHCFIKSLLNKIPHTGLIERVGIYLESKEISWLISQIEGSEQEQQRIVIHWLSMIYFRGNLLECEIVFLNEARLQFPEFEKEIFEIISNRQREEEYRKRKTPAIDPHEELQKILKLSSSDEIHWTSILPFIAGGSSINDWDKITQFKSVAEMSSWIKLQESEKRVVINLAKSYLQKADLRLAPKEKDLVYYLSFLYAYSLHESEIQIILRTRSEQIPLLCDYLVDRYFFSNEFYQLSEKMLMTISEIDPEKTLEAFTKKWRSLWSLNENYFHIKIPASIRSQAGDFLFDLGLSNPIQTKSFPSLIAFLRSISPQKSDELILQRLVEIQSHILNVNNEVVLSEALISTQVNWNLAWRILDQNQEYLKGFLMRRFYSDDYQKLVDQVKKLDENKEEALATQKLFIAISSFIEKNTFDINSNSFESRLYLYLWNPLLNRLINDGDSETLKLSLTIVSQDLREGVRNCLRRAEKNQFKKSFLPLEPHLLVKLFITKNPANIRSEEDLKRVIMEEILNLDKNFKYEFDLKTYQSYHENVFRARIANDLTSMINQRLIGSSSVVFPSSEVKADQEKNTGSEKRVDISFSYRNPQKPHNEFSVLLELKKISHDDVFEAMEEQLLGRYMKERQVKQGIYLVIHDQEKRESIATLRRRFKNQAAQLQLSNPEYSIEFYVIDGPKKTVKRKTPKK